MIHEKHIKINQELICYIERKVLPLTHKIK